MAGSSDGGADDIGEARLRVKEVMARMGGNSQFLTNLKVEEVTEGVWTLTDPLLYYSRILDKVVAVPAGFMTDFASVPRVPIAFTLYGDRAHHEGTLHDYLFRKNCCPRVSFKVANAIFYEAMECRGKPFYVRYPMYWAVCAFSHQFYREKSVFDKI